MDSSTAIDEQLLKSEEADESPAGQEVHEVGLFTNWKYRFWDDSAQICAGFLANQAISAAKELVSTESAKPNGSWHIMVLLCSVNLCMSN